MSSKSVPGKKVCLDLFAGLGGFSQSFEESENWDVFQVDIEERFDPDIEADVLDLRPDDLPEAILRAVEGQSEQQSLTEAMAQ